LKDSDPLRRRAAIYLLTNLGLSEGRDAFTFEDFRTRPDAKRTFPLLVGSLNDVDARARAKAAEGIGSHGIWARKVAGKLIVLLSDDDIDVRYQAVQALRVGGCPKGKKVKAVAALRRLLHTSSSDWRDAPSKRTAIGILATMQRKAMPALDDLFLAARSPELNVDASYAIQCLGEAMVNRALAVVDSDATETVRFAAAMALREPATWRIKRSRKKAVLESLRTLIGKEESEEIKGQLASAASDLEEVLDTKSVAPLPEHCTPERH
jgi:HEAT repeat protein